VKDPGVYLRHIIECIEAIGRYTRGGRESFLADRMIQKATLRELQEMAESTQRLSSDMKSFHPEVPWHDISGFRNVLVHDYLGLNLERVWSVVERDLSPLQEAAEKMLARLTRGP
jgi:uncharacterized protein with HEPN domain